MQFVTHSANLNSFKDETLPSSLRQHEQRVMIPRLCGVCEGFFERRDLQNFPALAGFYFEIKLRKKA